MTINNKKSKYTSDENIDPIKYTDRHANTLSIDTLQPHESYRFLGIYINMNLD